jgi:hypothetical protein
LVLLNDGCGKIAESNSIKIISLHLHLQRLFSFVFFYLNSWVFRFMDGGPGGWDEGDE